MGRRHELQRSFRVAVQLLTLLSRRRGGAVVNQTERNKQISRRWFEEGWAGNVAIFDELGRGEWMAEMSLAPQIEAFHAGFPDLKVEVEEQIAEGDKVATRVHFTGTHTGDLLGIPPTGKQIDGRIIEIHTFNNGKVVSVANDFHPVLVLAQIGAVRAVDDVPS
jgi:predicted ester cyclase